MRTNRLILVLYPNYFGMGYLICENSEELIDYGVAKIRPFTKSNYCKRLKRFIRYYRPGIVILRGYHNKDKRISPRVVRIIHSFIREAEKNKLPVFSYSREQIQGVFSHYGAATKYGISKTLSTWYPELKRRLPNLRRNQDAEHYQMGVFDAFALMITHFTLHGTISQKHAG